MNKRDFTRSPLESLAYVHPECEMHGLSGQNNLIVLEVYGKNHIRYLRYRKCQSEFSERKGTALWNCKIEEEQAIKFRSWL